MSIVDFIFFIAFIVFSLILVFLLLFVSKKIKRASYYRKVLFGAIFSICLLAFASSIFVFFFPSLFILFIGFIIVFLVMSIYLIKGASYFLKLESANEEKERAFKEEIESLKQRPNLVSNMSCKLFQIPQKWFEYMVSFFGKNNSFETDILPFIFKTIKEILDVDGFAFFVADTFDDSLSCKVCLGDFPPPYKLEDDVKRKKEFIETNFKHYSCNVGESVFGKVAKDGKPYYISSYQDDGIVFQNGDEDFLKIGSMIVLPLFIDNNVSGVFAISRSPKKSGFTEEDFKNASFLSMYLSSVLSFVILFRDYNEMALINYASDMAQEFRQVLLPKKIKSVANLDIDVYFMKQHGVCSDYYDIIPHKDRIFAVVLDVTGKGKYSVIAMIMIRAILYLITNTDEKLDSIMDWLNKGITGKLGVDYFSSISLLCYYPKLSKLEFIAAGNQSMILYKAEKGEVEVFQHKTDPIGIDLYSKYKSLTLNLSKGDIVSLYTDGISSMLNRNGECFEVNNLAKVIAEKSGESAKNIVSACCDLFGKFSEGMTLHDDQTLLVIKTK